MSKTLIYRVIVFACVLFSKGAWADFSGKVVAITDGDTLVVLRENVNVKVRLAEIDAPEKSQPYGKRSRQSLAELVFGKEVYVREEGRDRYGRTIGYVIHEGVNANREQVFRGMAWVYDRFAADRTLYTVQAEAREALRGLWADPAATPPWAWRKARR